MHHFVSGWKNTTKQFLVIIYYIEVGLNTCGRSTGEFLLSTESHDINYYCIVQQQKTYTSTNNQTSKGWYRIIFQAHVNVWCHTLEHAHLKHIIYIITPLWSSAVVVDDYNKDKYHMCI